MIIPSLFNASRLCLAAGLVLLPAWAMAQAASLCSGGETGSAYLRMWPHRHQTDGFFAAVWTRKD